MRAFVLDDASIDELFSINDNYELVEPLNISLDVRLRTVETIGLARVIIKGGLPRLKLDISKEKLLHLIDVVDTVTEPTPSSVATIESTPSAKIPENQVHQAEPMQPQQQTEIFSEMSFTIEELVLCVSSADGAIPLDATLQGLSANLCVNSKNTTVGMELTSLTVSSKEPRSASPQPIIATRVGKGEKFIDIQLVHVPVTPMYSSDSIVGNFGKMELNIDRVALAFMVQWANSLHAGVRQLKLRRLQPHAIQQSQAAPENNPAHQKRSGIDAEITISFTMSSLDTSLMRNGEVFLRNRLSGASIQYEGRENGTMNLHLALKGLSVKSFGTENKWPQVLSTNTTSQAVSLTCETFDKDATNFPGYETSVKLEMAAVEFVYTNRLIEEVIAYFQAFSRIRELISYAANQVVQAATDLVKETATSILHLEVDVDSPVIRVPISSQNSEHYLSLALGHIQVRNTIEDESGVVVDNMMIKVLQSNVKTHQIDVVNTLFLETDISITITRPIHTTDYHSVPSLRVDLKIPKIWVDFVPSTLDLLLAILEKNINEKIETPDTLELGRVASYLEIEDASLWRWNDDTSRETESLETDVPRWIEFVFEASLQEFGLNIFRQPGSLLVAAVVQQLYTQYTAYSNKTSQVEVTLQGIDVTDERKSVAPEYRHFLTPQKKEDKQLSLFFVDDTTYTSLKVDFLSPRIYVYSRILTDLLEYINSLVERIQIPSTGKSTEQPDKTPKTETTTKAPWKRQIMIFNITAPVVIVPSNFRNVSGPCLVVDLGHINVNSDSKDISRYDEFKIEMSDLYASIIDSSSIFTDRLTGNLVEKFAIRLNINKIREAATDKDTQDIIVKGNLPVLRMTLSPEKLRDLLLVVVSFNNGFQGGRSQGDSKIVTTTNTPEESVSTSSALVEFTIEDVVLAVSGGVADLLKLEIYQLKTSINSTTDAFEFQLALDRLFVEDCLEKKYLVSSPDGSTLGRLKLCSQSSPSYQTVDILFTSLDVHIRRITLAMLLNTINQFVEETRQPLQLLSQDTKVPSGRSALAPTESDIVREENRVKSRTSFKMEKFQILFHKEDEVFLRLSLVAPQVVLDMTDSTQCLTVALRLLKVRYIRGGRWQKIISCAVVDDSQCLLMAWEIYDINSPKYPGYDSSIKLTLASLKYVFLNQSIMELIAYFSAFAEIREVVEAQANRVVSATKERVKQKAEEKLKLHIEVKTPVIIVPASSQSADHLTINLGNISLVNHLEPSREGFVDKMVIVITNLSASSALSDTSSELCHDVHTDIVVIRPLDNLADPSLRVNVQVQEVFLEFPEAVLDLLFSILAGNLKEEAVKDTSELAKVSSYLNQLSAWTTNAQEEKTISISESDDKQSSADFVLEVSLGQLILQIASGTGKADQDESTALGCIKLSGTFSQIYSAQSKSTISEIQLKHLILQDTRYSTLNLYKEVLRPGVEAGTGPLVYLKIIDSGDSLEVVSRSGSQEFYVVPDVILSICGFLSRVSSKIQKRFSDEAEPIRIQETLAVQELPDQPKPKAKQTSFSLDLVAPTFCIPQYMHQKQGKLLVANLGRIKADFHIDGDVKGQIQLNKAGASLRSADDTGAAVSIIDEFEIVLDVILSGDDKMFEGVLPSLRVDISEDRVRDLLSISTTVATQLKDIPQLFSNQENIPQGVTPPQLNNSNGMLTAKFTIQEVALSLYDTINTPFLVCTLTQIAPSLVQHKDNLTVNMTLKRLLVEHMNAQNKQYLIKTPEESPTISLDYQMQGPLSKIVGRFASVEVNFDRVATATFIQFVDRISRAASSIATLQTTSPVLLQKNDSLVPKVLAVPETSATRLELDFQLSSLTLNLLKNGKAFLSGSIQKGDIKLEMFSDDDLSLSLEVDSISVDDLSNTMWPQLMNTRQDKSALKVTYNQYSSVSISQEYDAVLYVRLSTVVVTYTNRLISELTSYFGAFSRIQAVIQAASTAVVTATTEQAANLKRLKLDVEVSNPFFRIPQGHHSSHYIQLDLGRISLHNKFLRDGDEVLDLLSVDVEKVNVQAFRNEDEWTLFLPTDIKITVLRPISKNRMHQLPSTEVRVVVGEIQFHFSDVLMPIVLGMVKDNFSETIGDDTTELNVVLSKLQNLDPTLWTQMLETTQVNSAIPEENWVSLLVHVELARVGLQISEATGAGLSPLLSLQAKQLRLKLEQFVNNVMKISFTMKNTTLQDSERWIKTRFWTLCRRRCY